MNKYFIALQNAKARRFSLKKEVEKRKAQIKEVNLEIKHHEKARVIFQKSAKMTQRHLAKSLSGIVTKALQSIFDNPYKFVVEFVERRNTTECDLFLEKDGVRYNPLKSCGFGVADVISITLRISFLLISGKNKVLILDEPGRHISKDRMPYLSNVLKQLSSDLGIQFIIVTHSKELTEYADQIIYIKKEKNKSKLKI